MPWFITAICSRESIHQIYERHGPDATVVLPDRSRCFGFYDTYNEAYKAVEENRGNMEECLYDYLVIEYIEAGIHPMVLKEDWYMWSNNTTHRRWVAIEERPIEFKGTINWALG